MASRQGEHPSQYSTRTPSSSQYDKGPTEDQRRISKRISRSVLGTGGEDLSMFPSIVTKRGRRGRSFAVPPPEDLGDNHTLEEWEDIRLILYKLYIVDGIPLAKLREVLKAEHNFSASMASYSSKLSSWEFKNARVDAIRPNGWRKETNELERVLGLLYPLYHDNSISTSPILSPFLSSAPLKGSSNTPLPLILSPQPSTPASKFLSKYIHQNLHRKTSTSTLLDPSDSSDLDSDDDILRPETWIAEQKETEKDVWERSFLCFKVKVNNIGLLSSQELLARLEEFKVLLMPSTLPSNRGILRSFSHFQEGTVNCIKFQYKDDHIQELQGLSDLIEDQSGLNWTYTPKLDHLFKQICRLIHAQNILIRLCETLKIMQKKKACIDGINLFVYTRPKVVRLKAMKISEIAYLRERLIDTLRVLFWGLRHGWRPAERPVLPNADIPPGSPLSLVSDLQVILKSTYPPNIPQRRADGEESKDVWGYLACLDKRFGDVIELKAGANMMYQTPAGWTLENTSEQLGLPPRFSTGHQIVRSPTRSDLRFTAPAISHPHSNILGAIRSGRTVAVLYPLALTDIQVNGVDVGRKAQLELEEGDEITIPDQTRYVLRYTTNQGIGASQPERNCATIFDISTLERLEGGQSFSMLVDFWSTTAETLDIAVVSYFGAHVVSAEEHFSALSLYATDNIVKIANGALKFTPVALGCMGALIGDGAVWVLRHSETPQSNIDGAYVSTTIEDLADIWGPVWKLIEASKAQADSASYCRYRIGAGTIMKWQQTDYAEPQALPDEAFCHFVSSSSVFLPDFEEIDTTRYTKLLIGAHSPTALIVNPSCLIPQNEALDDIVVRPHGTSEDHRYKSSETFNLTLSYQGVQIGYNRQYKLRVGTSRKQRILQRWRYSPENRNPKILLLWCGLEISICTRNARKRQLLHILNSEAISLYHSHGMFAWESSECSSAFHIAIANEDPTSFTTLYIEHKEWRYDLGRAISWMLDALESTGINAQGDLEAFTFINDSSDPERISLFPQKDHTWTTFMKDTVYKATFAIAIDACLAFTLPQGQICRVDRHCDPRPSVLETMLIPKPSSNEQVPPNWSSSISKGDYLPISNCQTKFLKMVALLAQGEIVVGSSDTEHIRAASMKFGIGPTPKVKYEERVEDDQSNTSVGVITYILSKKALKLPMPREKRRLEELIPGSRQQDFGEQIQQRPQDFTLMNDPYDNADQINVLDDTESNLSIIQQGKRPARRPSKDPRRTIQGAEASLPDTNYLGLEGQNTISQRSAPISRLDHLSCTSIV